MVSPAVDWSSRREWTDTLGQDRAVVQVIYRVIEDDLSCDHEVLQGQKGLSFKLPLDYLITRLAIIASRSSWLVFREFCCLTDWPPDT